MYFEPPPDPSYYDCPNAPVYTYIYNFKTKEFTKGIYAKENIYRNELISTSSRVYTVDENIENVSIYHGDKLVDSLHYPRKFLGTYVQGTLLNTYYIENILKENVKTTTLNIYSKNLNNYQNSHKTIDLPSAYYDTILSDSIAVAPYNNSLYLITKNNIFRISNNKIAKTIPVTGIENYSVDSSKLYLFGKENIWFVDTKDKLHKLDPNNYANTNLNNIHPDDKFDIGCKLIIIETAADKKIEKASVYRRGLQCSQDYYCVEAELSDKTKEFYLLAEGSVLKLPETLKGKNYYIYKTTRKEYLNPVRKYYNLIISMPDTNWEFNYKTEYPIIITKTQAKIIYNDKELDSDTPPFMQNGSLLVPLGVIAKEFGAKVDFDAEKKVITLNKDNKEIHLTLNSMKATVNNKDVDLKSPAIVVKGRAMVPLRFISDNFGLKINLEYDYKNPDLSNCRISKVYIGEK